MRRAGRTDANQAKIVEIYRFVGATVAITSGAGEGFPDLVVGRGGENWLVEVKDGTKAPSARKLTKDEQYFIDHWTGRPVAVVEGEIQALMAIGFTLTQAQQAFAQFIAPKRKKEKTDG